MMKEERTVKIGTQELFEINVDNEGRTVSVADSLTGGEKTTSYLYDGNLLLAETDNSNKILKVYINDGQGIIGMVRYIYKDDGTFSHYQPLYYMFDSLGSVSLITGEDGKPLQNYKYTPYGASTNVESDPVNGLRFVGRYGGYQDDDTSLTYFWHRWYDSKDGRWISRDPIKNCKEGNKYLYTKNRPNSLIDYAGLSPVDALVPTYGNYCGPGYTGGERGDKRNFSAPAKDNLDSCCKSHDKCYYICDNPDKVCSIKPRPIGNKECKLKCDQEICNCTLDIGVSEGYNGDTYKYDYMAQAANYFCGK